VARLFYFIKKILEKARMPKKSHSSRQWLKQHFTDPYVLRAQKEGYRSRAVYKLLEIQEKDKIIRPGMTIIDLGAAPGGWSQISSELLQKTGRIIALDLLPIEPLDDITFIHGDFREESVVTQLKQAIANMPIDLVLSDMAPNMSGISHVDQLRGITLAELALDFCIEHLKPNGDFLTKIFQGVGTDDFIKTVRSHFKQVLIRKPKASRAQSAEIYLLARHKKSLK
jgi:23S rRNA (uridine2552-2'-O)-methyltransferase